MILKEDDKKRYRTKWYHGSPKKLQTLEVNSFITPFLEVAKAYSHKPKKLEISIVDNSELNLREVTLKHDGTHEGYVYRVIIDNLSEDITFPKDISGPLGEEMVTTKKLALELIQKVYVNDTYKFEYL